MPFIMQNQALALNAYAALLDETPGSVNLKYHTDFIDANGVTAYVKALNGLYPPSYPTSTMAADMLANLGLTSVFTQAQAEAYLDSAANRVEAVLVLAVELYYYSGSDAGVKSAQAAYVDSIEASYDYSYLPANVSSADLDSLNTTTFSLTTGFDNLSGTSLADAFHAYVVQNVNGEQTNQLATGDKLNGGAGDDSLFATIQAASALNHSPASAITPITVDVEHASFTALTVDNNDEIGNETVIINAKSMLGLDSVASVDSDASLLISNLTTLTDSGAYADRRDTDSITIRMDHTGNDMAVDAAADMTVLFDNDYLLSGTASSDDAVYWLEDRQGAAANPATPLDRINVDGIRFTVQQEGGAAVQKTLIIDPAAMIAFLDGTGPQAGTWEGFLALLQTALATAKATDSSLANLSLSLDYTNLRVNGMDGTILPVPAPAITLSATGTDQVTTVGFHQYDAASGAYDVFGDVSDNQQVTVDEPITSNIELYKVGRGADGGELTVGGMATDFANEFDYSATAIEEGVEQFNVTVFGDETQFSSLASLQSTNNTLRVVNVVTDEDQTGSYADLIIGNSNTDGYALKDVQIFNAATFKGDLTLDAALTDEVVAKYLDLQDEANAAPAADNVPFAYTGGMGDDDLSVSVSAANLAATGATTREDMALNIAGGEGDDMITLAVVDSNGNGNSWYDAEDANGLAIGKGNINGTGYANWYDNQKLEANLSISGGAGDDTIWTPGSGDVIINAGTGNDTVYADNTGSTAVWAFNVAKNVDELGNPVVVQSRYMLSNLQSDVNNKYNLFETDVVVTFKGYEVKVAIASVNGVATDLDINQAIKAAINSDPVLSKLLEATDGPANTLVVSSLIDGDLSKTDDLSISLEGPVAADLSATDVQQLRGWYGSTVAATDAASFATYFGTQIAAFDAKADYEANFARDTAGPDGNPIDGSDSQHTSDNTITGGEGNDVLVLGTGEFSNDTVVYTGFGNGTDTIVNFVDGDEGTTFVNTANVDELTVAKGGTYVQGTDAVAPVAGTAESFTLTLTGSAAAAAGGTITFDSAYFGGAVNATYLPTLGEAAASIATNAATAFNAVATFNWTAVAGANGTIVFTQDAGTESNAVDATVSNLDTTSPIRFDGSGVGMNISVTQQGAAPVAATGATNESFTVAFGDAAVAATYSFAGDTITVLAGESGENIAAAFASAGPTGWTATHTADTNTVTYTATTAGNIADVTDASFVGANIFTILPVEFHDNSDYLDFSSYNAEAVIVNHATAVDQAFDLAAAGEQYVLLTESTTNAGEYTMSVYTEAGATDTLVGLIGVADFGATQNFVADNFILA